MKQPENKSSMLFGNDGDIGNDAEIVIYYEINGEAKPVLKIPFWINKEGLEMGQPFTDMVDKAAQALADVYQYWPEGYIHVQTRINREHLNIC
tara:strand:+ start:838 stop:1116 length:279 start_codon:yes stop_codon:yes gene_type:complete